VLSAQFVAQICNLLYRPSYVQHCGGDWTELYSAIAAFPCSAQGTFTNMQKDMQPDPKAAEQTAAVKTLARGSTFLILREAVDCSFRSNTAEGDACPSGLSITLLRRVIYPFCDAQKNRREMNRF